MTKKDQSAKKVLILSDGKMGHQNQSIGLVKRMGITDYDIIKLERRRFGKFLSFISPILIVKNSKELLAKFNSKDYDIVVGLGSVPRLALLNLKKRKSSIKTICLMDPKRNYKDYDVIAVPKHDKISTKLDNVVEYLGSLSYFSSEELEVAKKDFKEEFKNLTDRPLIGLVIGGDSKAYKFTMLKARSLLDKSVMLANKLNANIYATTSRRTPEAQTQYIKYKLDNLNHNIYISGERNPYRAILGYSSVIIVTPETVSMLTEACATDALVLVDNRSAVKSSRVQSFIQSLIDAKMAFDLDEVLSCDDISSYLEMAKQKPAFDEFEKVVSFIKSKNII